MGSEKEDERIPRSLYAVCKPGRRGRRFRLFDCSWAGVGSEKLLAGATSTTVLASVHVIVSEVTTLDVSMEVK